MKPSDMINELTVLLNRLDGVTVLRSDCTDHNLRISMTIESHQSKLWLKYCAEASNVPLLSWCIHNPGSDEAISNPALALEYQYSVRKTKQDPDRFEDFNHLCAYLVWLMHYFEQLDTNEANHILDFCGAVHADKRKAMTYKINGKTLIE
jgi:hypothetical protein